MISWRYTTLYTCFVLLKIYLYDITKRYNLTVIKAVKLMSEKKGCNSTPRDHIAFKAILWNLVNKFSLMSISHCHRPKSDRDLLGGCPQISPDLVTMTNSRGDWS